MTLIFLLLSQSILPHSHKEMLHLVFKVLSLEIVFNLRGRFVLSLWRLLALEVELGDIEICLSVLVTRNLS